MILFLVLEIFIGPFRCKMQFLKIRNESIFIARNRFPRYAIARYLRCSKYARFFSKENDFESRQISSGVQTLLILSQGTGFLACVQIAGYRFPSSEKFVNFYRES